MYLPAGARAAMTMGDCMLKRHHSIRLSILLCLFWATLASAQNLRFSLAEKAWLNNHQELRVGVVEQTPPILFFSGKNNPRGLVADYLRALAQHLGLQLNVTRYLDENALMLALKNGSVDVVGAAIMGEEGQKRLIYTRPYLNLQVALFAKDTLPKGGLNSLKRKVVSVVKGSVWEKDLPLIESGIEIRTQPNLEQALRSVAEGKAAAYLGDAASANYLLKRQEIGDIEEQQRLDFTLNIALATPASEPELQSLMQKGFDRINSDELQEIWHRWPGVERPVNYTAGLSTMLIWIPLLVVWTLLVAWGVRFAIMRMSEARIGKFKRAIRRLQRRERRLKEKLLQIKRKALEYRRNSRQNRLRLRLLEDVMPNSAWTWDPLLEMCQWDDGMFSLYQQDPESFKPTPAAILQCVHEEDREKVALLYEQQDGGGDQRLSFRIILPDGEVRWLLDYSHFGGSNGTRGGYRVGICWDISEYVGSSGMEAVEQQVES
jgi:ABC-type amino acid transport substrate-binding protein